MSNATDQEQLTAQARASGAAGGNSPDFDAEHDQGVAQRSSRRDLQRRVADASGDKATPEQRAAQDAKANAASVASVNAAANYAAKEAMALIAQIHDGIAAAKGDAGIEPTVAGLAEKVRIATSAVTRLQGEIDAVRSAGVPVEQIQHAVAVFDNSYRDLEGAVHDLNNKVPQQESRQVTDQIKLLETTVFGLYKDMGWKDRDGITNGAIVLQKDGPQGPHVATMAQGQLLAQALDTNLKALIEGTQAAQLSQDGDVTTRVADLHRAIAHLDEMAHLVKTGDPKTVRPYKAKLMAALDAFHQMTGKIRATNYLQQTCGPILDQTHAEQTVQQLQAYK